MRKKRFILLLGALLVWLAVGMALAEPQAWARLFGVDTDAFPRVTAWIQAWDAQGRFITGIRQTDVALTEDGQPRTVISWEAQQPGAQVIVAVEAGHALGVRDNLGVTRYEYLYNQVHSWLAAPHPAIYDLNLVTSDGTQATHMADFQPFLATWEAYKPDTKPTETGLTALTAALQLTLDPLPRVGMGRAVLWITPFPTPQALNDLPHLLSLAQQSHTRVYIWLVGPKALQRDPQVQPLADFAAQTHGQLYFFSGEETLPVLDDLFEPLTHVYRLAYISEAIKGDQHTLAVTLHTPQGNTLKPEAVQFQFALQPPEVTLLDPPQQIVRLLPPGETDPATRRPRQVTLQVGVAFPDGHPRDLNRVALLVDGQPADVRTEPPYERLTWDVSAYDHGGAHTLQVEAEDVYGFTARSQPVTVQVSVPQPKLGVMTTLTAYRTPLTLAIVALAGVVLLAVLVMAGRHRPRREREAVEALPSPAARRVTAVRERWLGWLPRRGAASRPSAALKPLAYLVPLPLTPEAERTLPLLQIRNDEVRLGSDAAQADLVVPDPSVDPLHARLWRTDEGAFFIADQRSTAGTWINYAPVSPEGARLEEGDIVHLGRVGYRFRLSVEDEPGLTVRPLETE